LADVNMTPEYRVMSGREPQILTPIRGLITGAKLPAPERRSAATNASDAACGRVINSIGDVWIMSQSPLPGLSGL
jgi:hypothetical protein